MEHNQTAIELKARTGIFSAENNREEKWIPACSWRCSFRWSRPVSYTPRPGHIHRAHVA